MGNRLVRLGLQLAVFAVGDRAVAERGEPGDVVGDHIGEGRDLLRGLLGDLRTGTIDDDDVVGARLHDPRLLGAGLELKLLGADGNRRADVERVQHMHRRTAQGLVVAEAKPAGCGERQDAYADEEDCRRGEWLADRRIAAKQLDARIFESSQVAHDCSDGQGDAKADRVDSPGEPGCDYSSAERKVKG